MHKELKSIDVVLENCDVISFPRNVIGEFIVSKIERYISRVASNSISEHYCAKNVVFSIFSDGNVDYKEFRQDSFEPIKKFDRLTDHHDITAIELFYKDGSSEYLYVDYDEGELEDSLGAPNINEKTYISDVGNLYVVINAKKDIFDFFDKEEINNADSMEFVRDAYDIGVEEQEEHEFTADCLPKMYRFVYLESCKNGISKFATAVRVYDESGWKFIYVDDNDDIIPIPDKWYYPTDKIAAFINNQNTGKKDIKKIIEKYPVPAEKPLPDERDDYSLNVFWNEARKDAEDAVKWINECTKKYGEECL